MEADTVAAAKWCARAAKGGHAQAGADTRSTTLHFNVSTFCGIRRMILEMKGLRLSRKVDECKPLRSCRRQPRHDPGGVLHVRGLTRPLFGLT